MSCDSFEQACGRPVPYLLAPRRAGDVARFTPTRRLPNAIWAGAPNLRLQICARLALAVCKPLWACADLRCAPAVFPTVFCACVASDTHRPRHLCTVSNSPAVHLGTRRKLFKQMEHLPLCTAGAPHGAQTTGQLGREPSAFFNYRCSYRCSRAWTGQPKQSKRAGRVVPRSLDSKSTPQTGP